MTTSADLDVLRRWETAGGSWAVAGDAGDTVDIVLMTCHGDEQMGRLRSSDPDVVALARGRDRPDPGPPVEGQGARPVTDGDDLATAPPSPRRVEPDSAQA